MLQVLLIGQFRISKSTMLSYMPTLSLVLDAIHRSCFVSFVVKRQSDKAAV